MRFYYRIAFGFLLVCLLQDHVLGAPSTGRYMWLHCNPEDNNANCLLKKGPVMNLPGPKERLPPSAVKDIVPVESGEDTPETESEEQSGESSGDLLEPLDNVPVRRRAWLSDGLVPEVEEPVLEEEASGEVDYSNFVFPEPAKPELSEEDLREDNVIQ